MMMSLVKVTENYQVTIPANVCEKLGISLGDYLEVVETPEGVLFKPQKVDNDAWFWTEEWQKKEREADEAIVKGKMVGPFDNIDDALKALKAAKR